MISIGLPVYNAEKFLEFAIRSIVNQTFQEWELIIIDDGSTDSSMRIAESFTEDTRIRIYSDGTNKGLPSRLNESISRANFDYYARMDSDDIMHPERLRKQLDAITNGRYDVIGSAAYIIDTENNITGVRVASQHFDTYGVIQGSPFIHPTCLGSTQWFRNHPYNPKFTRSEDYELWLRAVSNSRFFNVTEPLLFYREVGLSHRKKYRSTGMQIIELLEVNPLMNDPVFSTAVSEKIHDTRRKVKVFDVMSRIGLETLMVRRRSKTLDDHDRLKATESLRRALT